MDKHSSHNVQVFQLWEDKLWEQENVWSLCNFVTTAAPYFHYFSSSSRVNVGKRKMAGSRPNRTGAGKSLALTAVASSPAWPDRWVSTCANACHELFLMPNVTFVFLHLFPASFVQELCGGTLLQTQVCWNEQVPNPGVWLWMGGLPSRGHHSGNRTGQRSTLCNHSIENKVKTAALF